ncbi:hypothetical protein niasHT_033367 [Heterodera trifolii]|uniref:Galectin n=1 Tax=Heterodera trifolii TaxID=157864 RepID=A0ABD2HXX5_9BILA
MEKDGISIGTNHWHGIKVQTKLTNGPGKQMRNTELETSFDDLIFNVGLNRRQFSIYFGDNLNDSVIILEPPNKDESLFADQRTLQNQFLNDLPNGEFLGEFTGLWLLGLDMVPLPVSQQNVQLYINRGCECAMEAWFIQPTDSAEPTDPNVPTVGSNSCPKFSSDLSFPFKITEMSSSFSITTLTDPSIKSVTIEVLDENKKDVELIFKLGTDNDLEVTLSGEEEEPIISEGTRLAKGAYVLHLEIVQNYHFLFKINGTQFGIKYWLKEWMKQNQTKWIKVQSQLLLLQDPIVKQNGKVIFGDVPTNATKISVEDEQETVYVLEEDRTYKEYPLRKTNYTKIYLKNTSTNPFKPIIVNIFMRGPFNRDAEMRINLFNRALEFHELFGTTVLMLKVRKTWAALNSFKDGKWLGLWQNDTLTIPKDIDHIHNDAPDNDDEPDILFYIMQVRQGKEIEIRILSKYDVSVQSFSYPTKVPINGIQYLTVEYENVVFDYEVEVPRQNSVER